MTKRYRQRRIARYFPHTAACMTEFGHPCDCGVREQRRAFAASPWCLAHTDCRESPEMGRACLAGQVIR